MKVVFVKHLMEETKKYEFTGETKGKLKRIRALKSFGNVKTGDDGGWIESESNLSHDGIAWVSGDAQVSENAQVFGTVRFSGDAQVDSGKYDDEELKE